LDASVIVALLNRRDAGHERCVRALNEINLPMVTCEAVVTESCHLLRHIPGAPEQVLLNLQHNMYSIRFNLTNSANTVYALMQKYRDTHADLADACLIQMADELNTCDILTLDSDFLHYRWRKTKRFNLLIPLI
jgi:predicted nucleic acid-binding protein